MQEVTNLIGEIFGDIFAIRIEFWVALVVALMFFGRVPVQYNLRNLLTRWPITLLTALAFTMVIALLTVMTAFVNGMNLLTAQSGQPGNVVVLSEGATDEVFSSLPLADAGEIELQPGVLRDPETKQPLASKETFLIINQPIDVAPGQPPKRRFVQVRGVDDPQIAATVHGLKLRTGGEWFSEAGVRTATKSGASTAPETAASVSDSPAAGADPSRSGKPGQDAFIEAVIGSGLAHEMGNDRPEQRSLQPGDQFVLGNLNWIVVGVMESEGATFDSEVWAKRSLVGPMFGKNNYTSLILRTKGANAAAELAKTLKLDFKKSNLDAQPETAYFARLGETSKQFAYAIGFVTFVMSIGGMFGIMNTMFAAISQRTKDIGVLRIVGYPRWQVLCSFLLESMLLAIVGGLLGCAIGSLCDGWTAKSVVSAGQGAGSKFVVLKLNVDWPTLILGMRVALWMGLLGGLLPSISAMRLRPLESMR